jgi:hypothetical protein
MKVSNTMETSGPNAESTSVPRPRATEALGFEPSVTAQPVEQAAPVAISIPQKPVEKRRPLIEAEPLEPIRIQKKLTVRPITPEELSKRLYSTLMDKLGLTVSYIYSNYGEKSGARLWQYLEEVAELSQEKSKMESFGDFVSKRVEEDKILGIEHEVSEFFDNKFVSHVRDCRFKASTPSSGVSAGRPLEELPCMLCEATWQGSCRAMRFQLQLTKEKSGCTVSVEKTEPGK